MRKDLLRLIYQKRFKLMNRWNARALPLQPRFGVVADPSFRSFIFHAFEEIARGLRNEGKETGAAHQPLLQQIAFPVFPDSASYLRAIQIGGEVLESFLREDPVCLRRFPRKLREEACETVRETVAEMLSTENRAYRKQQASAKNAAYCAQCGRPWDGPGKS